MKKVDRRALAVVMALGALVTLLTLPGPAVPVTVEIPAGATLPEVAEILEDHGVVGNARLFHLYVRARRADRKLKAGTYRLESGSSMRWTLDRITRGEVVTVTLAIPEGFAIWQMAPRIAEVTSMPDSVVKDSLLSESLAREVGVPGPTLEGYLFPDTYRFAEGVPLRDVVDAMVSRYRDVWTEKRAALLEASGLDEREAVTLASIIQAEARHVEEMPRISGVYHNRLREGWRLHADPTVLYALGGYRARLLFAAIDSVEDNPYNTYAHGGLPPGPIGSPGELAIDAALSPEEHDYMYFVARPDGYHVFTRSLAAHNDAIAEIRAAR